MITVLLQSLPIRQKKYHLAIPIRLKSKEKIRFGFAHP